MNSFLRTPQKSRKPQPLSQLFSLFVILATSTAIGVAGGLSLLLLAVAISVTGLSLYTGKGTEQIINRLPAFMGGYRHLFLLLAVVAGVSVLAHGQPAHALFDGAKDAANSGIGTYIGEDEATSIIDIIIFGMWALAAVGGIATIAGGALQNIMVLVGGMVLFFGMAVLIGVLEFTDGLLFAS